MSDRKKSNRKKGLAPGTAAYVGEHEPQETVIELSQYNPEALHTFNISDLNILFEKLSQFEGSQWVSVTGLANAEIINSLCQFFNVHGLVVENIMNTTLRPTVENYEDYTFLSMKMRKPGHAQHVLYFEQFCILFVDNIIITFQESKSDFFDIIKDRLANANTRVRHCSTNYLAYLFMDYIVDDYMCYLDERAESIEHFEDLLIAESKKFSLNNLYLAKRQISLIRKVTLPLLENINKITRAEVGFIEKKLLVFYKDLNDHCLRVIETADGYREIISTMFDIYLSQSNNKTNEIIRVLTIFASIFIPLTFISSVYGMNFEHIPELDSRYGFYVALCLMAVIAGALLLYFRRKKWI